MSFLPAPIMMSSCSPASISVLLLPVMNGPRLYYSSMNHRDACSQVTGINDGLNSVQQIGVQDTSSEEFKSLQSKEFHLARRGGTASVMLNEGVMLLERPSFQFWLICLQLSLPSESKFKAEHWRFETLRVFGRIHI